MLDEVGEQIGKYETKHPGRLTKINTIIGFLIIALLVGLFIYLLINFNNLKTDPCEVCRSAGYQCLKVGIWD